MLTSEQLARDLAVRDLTDPAEGPHAIQQLIDLAVGALVERWRCDVHVARGPRVVLRSDNYDALGFPPEAVTRDERYTRYVDGERMLRSHSSAMVPPALRALASEIAAEPPGGAAPGACPPALGAEERGCERSNRHDDVLLVCPGITYRRDAVDRRHTGTPHQLDLWRITTRPMGEADLDEMIDVLAGALVPGEPYRADPRVHPYTLAGRQVDVLDIEEWVEVWECGLAHPDVLRRAGLSGRTGLALGMGLDRLVMLRKGIPDIRLLRATEPRVASQLLDLEPYRPISALPAVVRDLSIAVDTGDDAELLGDRARDALGDDADCLESIEVLSETAWLQLPDAAVRRLGMDASQKNVLARIVLRPCDRTLTDAEANTLRDRVYAALHRGRVMTWASSGGGSLKLGASARTVGCPPASGGFQQMNKAELVSAIADKTGQSHSVVGDVLGAFESVVTDQVVGGNKVQIPGFLSFEKSERAARTGRNPATGEEMQIPASTVPKVKVGKSFKDAVNK